MYPKARAWIELNMANLASNLGQIRRILPRDCGVMPAVKANAYGHGAVLIGRALQELGVRDFCVAAIGEAVELREAGIQGEILILGYTSPQDFPLLTEYGLTQTVLSLPYAKLLQAYGQSRQDGRQLLVKDCRRPLYQSRGLPLPVHVAIDTGMHRIGERCENFENICRIWEMNALRVTGVFSHLCVSDNVSEADRGYTRRQIREFDSVIRRLKKRGIAGFQTHIQGSYGILNYPELHCDLARPGIALYGVLSSSRDRTKANADLKPVLSLKARIACVNRLRAGETAGYGRTYTAETERKTAVVSIGYADGVPRALSNRGAVLVNGKRAPIIGRVCMDQLLIDVTEIPRVSPGDTAVLIGQSGEEQITACEFARMAGTISNEILSGLGSRLARITADCGNYT